MGEDTCTPLLVAPQLVMYSFVSKTRWSETSDHQRAECLGFVGDNNDIAQMRTGALRTSHAAGLTPHESFRSSRYGCRRGYHADTSLIEAIVHLTSAMRWIWLQMKSKLWKDCKSKARLLVLGVWSWFRGGRDRMTGVGESGGEWGKSARTGSPSNVSSCFECVHVSRRGLAFEDTREGRWGKWIGE